MVDVSADRSLETTLCGVLVSDIVGSTRIRSDLGDHRADALFLEHDELVTAAVARNAGEIAEWQGDGILAVFPSASGALRAAVSIQQGVGRLNSRADRATPLAVRIGVSGGAAGRSDPTECRGPTVEQATALCEKAEGGQILASRQALDLAGTRVELAARPHGRGTVRILWSPLEKASRRIGVPPPLSTDEQLEFVGRRPSLASIRSRLRQALSGRARLVILEGEAGVGKTRLAAEIARLALDEGAAVLFGACREELALPYAPFEQALRYWLDHVEDAAERLGPTASELLRFVPKLQELLPGLPAATSLDPESERTRFYDAITHWLVQFSRDEPLVLVLDSLHWAEESTFRLLLHLIEGIQSERILTIATFRTVGERARWLEHRVADTLGPDFVDRVELTGLAIDEVEELTRRFADAETARRLAGALHASTGGNPLHIAQLLRDADGVGNPGQALPDGIRSALQMNLGKLGTGHRRVLEIASVLGSPFGAALVGSLSGDPDVAFEALEAAQRLGLVEDLDRAALIYRFSHDLTRELVYSGIGAARLARLHQRAGRALEGEVESRDAVRLTDLARHFVRALPLGDRGPATHYSVLAAKWALDNYANEQAAELFGAALDLIDPKADPELWCETAVGRGEALRRVGDQLHRAVLFEAADFARAHGHGELMARALVAAYRGTFSRAFFVDTEYVTRLQAALDLLGPAPSSLRARLLALLAVETAWDFDKDENGRVLDEACGLARQVGDVDLLAEALLTRQWCVFHPLEERLRVGAELERLIDRVEDPALRFQIAGMEVFSRIRAGDGPGYRVALQQMRGYAREADQPLVQWMRLIRESAVALMEARFDDAEALIDEGHRLGIETAQPDQVSQDIVQRFWLTFEIEPVEQARTRVAALSRVWEQTSALSSWPSIAFRCCDLDLGSVAEPITRALIARGLGAVPVDQVWLMSLCQISISAAHLGDRAFCEELMEALRPHSGCHANVVFASMGSVARYLGLLAWRIGRLDDAADWLHEAIESNRQMGAASWTARSQLDLARLGFERSGREHAPSRQLLGEAREAAERLRLPTVLDQTRQALEGVPLWH